MGRDGTERIWRKMAKNNEGNVPKPKNKREDKMGTMQPGIETRMYLISTNIHNLHQMVYKTFYRKVEA